MVLQEIAAYKFELRNQVLMASWDDSLSSESLEFYQSFEILMQLIIDENVKCLFVDSGNPAGGTVTEDIIQLICKTIPQSKIEKIALLESTDYHWDNNIVQLMNFLKSIAPVPFHFRIYKTEKAALFWLNNPEHLPEILCL